MKNLVLVGAVGLALVGCATTPPSDPMLTYQRIVEIPDVKQDVIYEGSRQWVAKSFKSANSVIQYQDKATGSIIGKGNMDYTCTGGLKCLGATSPILEFTIKIDAKDGKARVSFSDLNIHHPSGYSALAGGTIKAVNYSVTSEQDKAQVKTVLDKAIDSLSIDVKNTSADSQW